MADFVDYPSVSSKDWPGNLTAKEEMHPRVHVESCEDPSYRLQSNQQFVRNYMLPGTPYRSLLLFHGVGVGKTCAAVHVAEQYLTEKKAIMIVPDQIQSGFRNSIYNADIVPTSADGALDVTGAARFQCTGTKYAHQEVASREPELDARELGGRMKMRIGLKYKFMGERAFGNEVKSIIEGITERFSVAGQDAIEREIVYTLKSEYDNRVIVIDEAHELRQDGDPRESYQMLMKTLAVCDNIRLLLLTATPMYHRASEVVDLLNLMLANENETLLDKSEVFRSDGEVDILTNPAKLTAAMRGRVSHVGGANPRTFPIKLPPPKGYVGWAQPKLSFKGKAVPSPSNVLYKYVVSTEMSQIQCEAYRKVAGGRLQALQQLSNVAFFPEAFENKDEEIRKAYIVRRSTESDVRFKYRKTRYLSPGNIAKHAPKIALVVKSVLDCISKTDGVCFVYSNFIDFGTEQVAIALEEHGIGPFGNTKPRLIDDPSVKPGANKYVLITKEDRAGSSFSTQKKVDIVNNPKKNVRVIIGSQYASQGLDFKRIREVHVLDPWWNVSRTNQVVGRAVRRCSHSSLPEDQRNVTVFYHCSVLPSLQKETVEQYMYRRAFAQQKGIRLVETLLERNAVDCDLAPRESFPARTVTNSKGRRVSVPGSQRGASECSVRWPKVGSDSSTVHPYQYAALVDVLAWEVRDHMLSETVATYEQIKEAVGSPSDTLLSLTLQKLLDPIQGGRWLAPYGTLQYRGVLYVLISTDMENGVFTMSEVLTGSRAKAPSIQM